MRIVVHDYSGHPFQIHLSRQLAKRGHAVTHIYYADNHGPKGTFVRPDDPASLQVVGIRLDHVVEQSALIARRFNDVAYGKQVASLLRKIKPDVIICGNTPPDAQTAILKTCKATGITFVYWLQDVYSVAVSKLLTKQFASRGRVFGVVGLAIGTYYRWIDRRQFRNSDAVIVITEDFRPLAISWAGLASKVTVIENWAALEDFPVRQKSNDWSRRHDLDEHFTFLYSGTLGRKHNPTLLYRLAQNRKSQAVVTVVAQGVGMKQLEAMSAANLPDGLKLMPLQLAADYADVMATADVLIATIESDAGTFAVPSKVLSYLCSGRPILLAAPRENLAARTVLRANAGIVVGPDDEAGFLAAAVRLQTDPALRAFLGANGRAYAERTFNLPHIADQFECVIQTLRPHPPTLVEPQDPIGLVTGGLMAT